MILFGLDLTYFLSLPVNSPEQLSLWTMPVWRAVLVTGLVLSFVLKVVQTVKVNMIRSSIPNLSLLLKYLEDENSKTYWSY